MKKLKIISIIFSEEQYQQEVRSSQDRVDL